VTLNPSDPADTVGATISWDDDFEDDVLQLNSPHANSVVILTNPINLDDDDRNVIVWDNPFKTSDWAEISGVMSGLPQDDFSKHGPGKLVLSADNTYGGATTVTDGTLVLTGNNAYMGGTYMAAGTVVAAQSDSLGGGPLVFNGGGLELMDTFGSATRAARIGDGGATVNTPAGTSLTLTPGGGGPSGDLTKLGDGSLTVASGFAINGEINFLGGTLNLDPNALAQTGGAVFIGAGLNLKLSGSAPRKFIAGDLSSTIAASGPLALGDQGANNFDFGGILNVGSHPVAVLGPPGTPMVNLVIMDGGTLTGVPELKVAPGGFVFGEGTLTGTVRLGEDPVGALGLQGLRLGQELVLSGLVTGVAPTAFVKFTGAPRLGFSPTFNITRGTDWGETVFQIVGTTPGELAADPGGGADIPVAGDYTQFLVYGEEAGTGGQLLGTIFRKPSLEAVDGFSFDQLAAGDQLFLITAAPARVNVFVLPFGFTDVDFEAGGIEYDPNFAADLQSALKAIDLAPGLEWAAPIMSPQNLIIMVVPEPGTLLLLLSGGLGLVLLVWRRRRS
jgi:autotransporter-associated beta strand protein